MTKETIKIKPLKSSQQDSPITSDTGQLSVDIYQSDDEIVVLAPIAGITMNDISINITDDILIIKGQRKLPANIPVDNYYTKECFWGNFARSIVLPVEADKNKVEATFENAILEVRIGKTKVERTKIIQIKTQN